MAHEEELVNMGLASAEKVKELNSSLTQAEYKTIVRTQLNPGALGVSCPDWGSSRWTSPKAPSQNSPKRKGMEKQ